MLSKLNFTNILLIFVCLTSSVDELTASEANASGKKEGYECILCTFGVGLVEQLSQVHNETITHTLQRVCKLFGDVKYRSACDMILQFIGPKLVKLLYRRYTPDVVCARLSLCPRLPDGRSPKCRLFPKYRSNGEKLSKAQEDEPEKELLLFELPSVSDWPGAQFFSDYLHRARNLHSPFVDIDRDGFSTVETLRGSAWRGKDCDDEMSSFHPGARPLNQDTERDSNCNGILGVDFKTGQPYEKLYCERSQPRGIMIIGDSAGAHFHIPEQWLDARLLSRDLLTHLPYVFSNEFDWPMMSFTTGYKNITWPVVDGYAVSVYSFLKRHNLCNHRDYHNLCVNGAKAGDPATYIRKMSIRNNETDHPLLLFYEFVGNDVCNWHNDTVAHMTTPKQMKKNVLETLRILDSLLPSGSHVLMTGLANGSFLWEALHSRYHPIGRLNRDVRYPEFYDFLTCIGANPCNGWMTTNDTLRRITTERAAILSEVIHQVAREYKHHFRNFDLDYISCPLTTIVENWEKHHGSKDIWKLIEAVDGFHPNQLAGNLIAEHVWRHMKENLPHFIGPENPHNEQIAAIFGDQGGYN